MGYILKIIVVFALVEFYNRCEATPTSFGGQKFTVLKPTFISTAQFVDRCAAAKVCTRTNIRSQCVGARISSKTKLPSLKVQSLLSGSNKTSRRTNRGKELIDAVKKNDLRSLSKLIAGHVDVNERFNDEMTALHWASEYGHTEAAKMLIQNNAEIDAREKYFNTPLHIACSHDFTELIELLIDSGANLFAVNLMKLYPLKLCTINTEKFRPILMKATQKGEKLFSAVESGDLKLVQKLIGQRVNINFGNPCGDTCLTVAISKGNKTMVEWLVNNGADVNIESCDGMSPLDLAKKAGMTLPPSKSPDWKSIITTARNTINHWLVYNPPQKEIEAAQRRNHHSLTWIAYHPLGDIFNFLDHLCQYDRMTCTIREIRNWMMNDAETPLKVLKISNGNKNNKAVWIDGGIHGNEWISTSVVTYIANELIKNWNKKDVQNIDWYILAVQNPDGYKYAYESDRFWRKNRAPTGQGDSIGIDLNRNYDFKWGESDSVGNPNDDTYGGTSAFSEHETSTIKTFIVDTMKGKFSAFISFQGYGQYVMYPGDNDKDGDNVKMAAIQGVKRMKAVDNQNYKVGTSQSLFNASAAGVASEWAKSVGIKYSYTVNLRDTGRFGSLLPPSFIETTAQEAHAFVLAVMEAILSQSK